MPLELRSLSETNKMMREACAACTRKELQQMLKSAKENGWIKKVKLTVATSQLEEFRAQLIMELSDAIKRYLYGAPIPRQYHWLTF